MAWKKLDEDTLTSSGDTLTVTYTANTFNTFLTHQLDTGGVIASNVTFNNDTGNNYVRRESIDGGSDATSVNRANIDIMGGSDSEKFGVGYFINIAGDEKLLIVGIMRQISAGSGTAPQRREVVGKWTNTSVQSTEMDLDNPTAGSYDTDTNLSLLGTD